MQQINLVKKMPRVLRLYKTDEKESQRYLFAVWLIRIFRWVILRYIFAKTFLRKKIV